MEGSLLETSLHLDGESQELVPVGGRQPMEQGLRPPSPQRNDYHVTFLHSDSASWGAENIYEELFF